MAATVTESRPTELIDNLRDYQHRGVDFLQERNGIGGIFAEMRTGKTRLALYYILPRARRVLVVTPLGGMGIWEREARALGYAGEVVLLNEGSSAEKAEVIGWAKDAVIVISYDSYWRDGVRQAILKWEPSAVILDEAQNIKDRTSKRSKFAHILGRCRWVQYRIPMTGTPVTNKPLDVFSIYLFMDPSVFGHSFHRFRDAYAIMDAWTGYTVKQYINLEDMKEKVAATSFSISKAEALPNLPPREAIVEPVVLTGKTRVAYADMKKDALAIIEDAAGREHRALGTIVLSQLMRLQQITSGFVQTTTPDGRKGEIIDIGSEKLEACCSLARTALENGERVVVFCRFLHDIARVAQALDVPAGHVVTGKTPGPARKKFEEDHLAGKVPLAVLQLKVSSTSWDLAASSVGIYYSLDFSVVNFTQSRERQHGSGQQNRVLHYYLTAKGTVDERVLADLSADLDVAARVVDLDYVRGIFA